MPGSKKTLIARRGSGWGQIAGQSLWPVRYVGRRVAGCNDWYEVDYYANSRADNPRGPEQGEKKVLRGGGFRTRPKNVRAPRGIATSLVLPTPASRPTMAASVLREESINELLSLFVLSGFRTDA